MDELRQVKALNQIELDQLIVFCRPLLGSELNRVQQVGELFRLQFYGPSGSFWLNLNLKPGQTLMALSQSATKLDRKGSKGKSPVVLFLDSHFKGRPLDTIEPLADFGRVFKMVFQGAEIEIRLIPTQPNLIARAAGKSISWNRIKEMTPVTSSFTDQTPVRSPLDLLRDLESLMVQPIASGLSIEKPPEDFTKKRETLISRLESDLEKKLGSDLLRLAEVVRQTWDEGVCVQEIVKVFPEKKSSSFPALKDWVFAEEKRAKEKIKRLQDRIEELKTELPPRPAVAKPGPKTREKVSYKTLRLSTGDRLFVGKNAHENLKLLRAAQPWYLWLHIKDIPAAYGIVELNRGQVLNESVVTESALAYLAELRKRYPGKLNDSKTEVIIAECRHVRPIKGEKLGRVRLGPHRTKVLKLERD